MISAIAAFTGRETFRVRLHDLGHRDALPMDEGEYERLRARALRPASSSDGLARA